MRISHVKIINVLGLEELEFDAGQFVEFSGQNRGGKTSAIEAIKSVFKGGHDATLIRDGAKHGETVLVLDDGTTLTQRITAAGSTVGIKRDGKAVPRPAEAIKALVDQISVNPIDFLKADKKRRVNVLLQSIPLKIDVDRITEIAGSGVKIPNLPTAFETIESVRTVIYDDRTGTKRALREKLATINQLSATLPADQLATPAAGDDPTADLMRKMKEIDSARDTEMLRIDTKLDGLRKARDAAITGTREAADVVIASLEEKISALEAEIQEEKADRERLVSEQNQAFADIEGRAGAQRATKAAEFTAQRAEASQQLASFQERVESIGRFAQTRKTIATLQAEADALTSDESIQDSKIGQLDSYKSEILASLPIDGLAVVDGEIIRHGVAFDRLNSEQQVGIAFEIAKLRAGNLGVVCIDGIEQLNSEHYERFTNRALKSGLQMFVTRVADHPFEITTQD